MDNYIAVIADIKKSKSNQNRDKLQEIVIETLSKINEKYFTIIASNFAISSGDSFQGLLKNGDQIMNLILDIELELFSNFFAESSHLGIRYGIGIGSISTVIYEEDSNLVDGKAYHMAKTSLDDIKKEEESREKVFTCYKVSKEGRELLLINSLLSLLSIIQKKWTKNQVQVIQAYIDNNYKQQQTAKVLGKSSSSISSSLARSSFFSIRNSIDILNEFIEKERTSF